MATAGVYHIRHRDSGRAYVGAAENVQKRWKDHVRMLAAGDHHSSKLQVAWDQHGAEAFDWTLAETVSDVSQLRAREQAWIDLMRAFEAGFNMRPTADSMLGFRHRPESIEATRRSHIGRVHSPEERARRAASLASRSPEEKAAASAKRSGSLRQMHACRTPQQKSEIGSRLSAALVGRIVQDSTRQKISQKLAGRELAPGHVAALRASLGKLTDDQRRQVVERRAAGESFRSIGRSYGVTHEAVRKIYAFELRVPA